MASGIQILLKSFGIDVSPEKIQAGIAEAQELVSNIASSLVRIEAQNLIIMDRLGIAPQQIGEPYVGQTKPTREGRGNGSDQPASSERPGN